MEFNDKKPKILFVANVAKEHILKFHVPTIKMLKDEGWHVDVACSGNDVVPYCDRQFEMSYKRSPFNLALFKGIKELKKIINEGEYDIVYCHTPVGGVAARIASKKARKKGTRVIYFAHGLHFFKGASLINWICYYPIEKILSKKTDDMILINQEDYELVNRKFKVKNKYLLNGIGINLAKFKVENRAEIRSQYRKELNIPENATVLIYCAELLKNKNQTYLMRVLKKVLEKNGNTYLILAGIDHSDGKFINYAKKLGIYDNVRFLGWRNDIGNLYVTSDICTPTSIREGFGINLVEAMYLQIPVIATNNRGHKTIIRSGENGFLVPLNDEDEFANKILDLMSNNELRNKIIQKAYSETYKYTSEEILTELIKILEG